MNIPSLHGWNGIFTISHQSLSPKIGLQRSKHPEAPTRPPGAPTRSPRDPNLSLRGPNPQRTITTAHEDKMLPYPQPDQEASTRASEAPTRPSEAPTRPSESPRQPSMTPHHDLQRPHPDLPRPQSNPQKAPTLPLKGTKNVTDGRMDAPTLL